MDKKTNELKIIFYTATARAFRTTLIGYLYQIAKDYSVILISENLDSQTNDLIRNKKFFPGIRKIIPVNIINKSKFQWFSRQSIRDFILIKNIFIQEKPNIVITSSDMHTLPEIYINRLGKKYGAINISILATMQIEAKKVFLWRLLLAIQSNKIHFLPFTIKKMFFYLRQYLGSFLCYWLFPLIIREKPFRGKSNNFLTKGNSGMRDANYQIVFSERDRLISIKDGVNPSKIIIMPHPLETTIRDFLQKAYFNKAILSLKKKYITLMMPDVEIGFLKQNNKLINREERLKEWVNIVKIVSFFFPNYTIILKPHPNTNKFLLDLKNFLLSSKIANFIIANPSDPADWYVSISDVIIGLPMSATTTLFIAKLQNPEKTVIAINFKNELLGDCYKEFKDIFYAESQMEFLRILNLIKKKKLIKKKHLFFKQKSNHPISLFLNEILLKNAN